MDRNTRRIFDWSFTGLGFFSILIMAVVLLVLLVPIAWQGSKAYYFKGTTEFRRLDYEQFHRGDKEKLEFEQLEIIAARAPMYELIEQFEAELDELPRKERKPYKKPLREVKALMSEVFGPAPGSKNPVLLRKQYGQTRWDRAQEVVHLLLNREEWDYSSEYGEGVQLFIPREKEFEGTSLAQLFPYIEENFERMMRPRRTFYWRFLTDKSMDSHMFGGIGPEVLGTLYLTLGAILFAVPIGIIAAIYLCEYARPGRLINMIRSCISTLAGVPSIVFGLFGMAFFINTLHVSPGKSVLAGSLTLSLMILPTVIRASEEAILAVPQAYKEAALGLGAGRWHTVWTVILPASMPGILTGVVISMGRAAGETAPIIFTAAVSLGAAPTISELLTSDTPALPWNIYNLCTEHEAVDAIRHVQFGMVLTLIALVLLLNFFAIVLRARMAKKLKG